MPKDKLDYIKNGSNQQLPGCGLSLNSFLQKHFLSFTACGDPSFVSFPQNKSRSKPSCRQSFILKLPGQNSWGCPPLPLAPLFNHTPVRAVVFVSLLISRQDKPQISTLLHILEEVVQAAYIAVSMPSFLSPFANSLHLEQEALFLSPHIAIRCAVELQV